LVIVKVSAVLVLLRFWAGKVRDVGLIVMVKVGTLTGRVRMADLTRCRMPVKAAEAWR
jgi:hypothetical protein